MNQKSQMFLINMTGGSILLCIYDTKECINT